MIEKLLQSPIESDIILAIHLIYKKFGIDYFLNRRIITHDSERWWCIDLKIHPVKETTVFIFPDRNVLFLSSGEPNYFTKKPFSQEDIDYAIKNWKCKLVEI